MDSVEKRFGDRVKVDDGEISREVIVIFLINNGKFKRYFDDWIIKIYENLNSGDERGKGF